MLEQHRWAYGAYYQLTADLPRNRDLVRLFHEAWDHSSCDLMCSIVNKHMIANILEKLTAKINSKYFPACEACHASSMAKKSILRTASDSAFVPGEEFQHIKV